MFFTLTNSMITHSTAAQYQAGDSTNNKGAYLAPLSLLIHISEPNDGALLSPPLLVAFLLA